MSSTRWIVSTLKMSSIAAVNIGAVSWGLEQYRHNQEIVRNMLEAQREMLAQNPVNQYANSGDALAVFNERMHR